MNISFKVWAFIAAFILGLVYRDLGAICLGFAIVCGLSLLLGMVVRPLGILGGLMVPWGLFAGALGFLLLAIPPIPGINAQGPGGFETIPAVSLPRIADFWWQFKWIGAGMLGIAIVVIGGYRAWAREHGLIARNTHPMIARALADRSLNPAGLFDGFVTADGSVHETGSIVLESAPVKTQITTEAQEDTQDSTARIILNPSRILDQVISALFEQQIGFDLGDVGPQQAEILVKRRDEPRVKAIIEKFATV